LSVIACTCHHICGEEKQANPPSRVEVYLKHTQWQMRTSQRKF
jgi:hypothetical protein